MNKNTTLDKLLPAKLPFPWVVAKREPDLVVLNEIMHNFGLGGMQKDMGLAIAVHAPEKINGKTWVQLVLARPNQPPLLSDFKIARDLIFGSKQPAIYRVPVEGEEKDPRQATIWVELEPESRITVVKPEDLKIKL